MGGERGKQIMDEGAMDFSMEELQEFLEGDRVDVRADPAFKERLRRKLWDMVRERVGRPPESSS
jgi:ribosomal protein L21E